MYSKTLTTYVFSLTFCIEMKYVLHVFAFKQGSDCLTLCHLLYLRHLKKKIILFFYNAIQLFLCKIKIQAEASAGTYFKESYFFGPQKDLKKYSLKNRIYLSFISCHE